jgi:tryptophan-rich sensory protein
LIKSVGGLGFNEPSIIFMMDDTNIFFALALSSFFAFSIEDVLRKAKSHMEKLAMLAIPAIILSTLFFRDIPVAMGGVINYLIIFLFLKLIKKMHDYDEKIK